MAKKEKAAVEEVKQEEGTAVEAVKETVDTEALEKVATVLAEQAPKAFDALKSVGVTTFLTPEVTAQLIKLGKVIGVASLDAALVSLNDNIATVEIGTWKPLVVTMVSVLVREARNALHGGPVKDGGTSPVDPAPTEPKKE